MERLKVIDREVLDAEMKRLRETAPEGFDFDGLIYWDFSKDDGLFLAMRDDALRDRLNEGPLDHDRLVATRRLIRECLSVINRFKLRGCFITRDMEMVKGGLKADALIMKLEGKGK